jgi:hypothetical protein
VASASSKAKANIQKGNGYCGVNHPELPTIGTVSFKRVGNVVTLKVAMRHDEPNTTYEMELWASECQFIEVDFTFTTNKKGVGKRSGAIEVSARDTEFVGSALNAKEFNDTTVVKLR